MMIYLLTGQWSSTGQLIIFQYPSMVDEKNNGLTQRSEQSSKYSESHLATPCISVSFLVQKVMGGEVDWGSPAKSSDPACNQIQRIYMKFS